MAFSDWSTVDTDNATTSGISIPEGCPAANMNNWGRRIMSQLRAAIAPVWDTILSCTTLAQIRTALGVTEGSASMTAFGNLTNTAASVPRMLGSDTWELMTVTSFAKTLLDDGDAATALATLGAPVFTTTSNANGLSLNMALSGTTYRLQKGSVTVSGAGTTAITFPEAFSGTPSVVCSGGHTNSSNSANDRITAVSSSGASITSDYGSSHTSYWIAFGS